MLCKSGGAFGSPGFSFLAAQSGGLRVAQKPHFHLIFNNKTTSGGAAAFIILKDYGVFATQRGLLP
jgi:hypothetical protein